MRTQHTLQSNVNCAVKSSAVPKVTQSRNVNCTNLRIFQHTVDLTAQLLTVQLKLKVKLYVCVGGALKLVPPFKGNKQEFLAFIGNADTAFAVINPSQEAILYKFVLTRISGSQERQLVTGTSTICRNLKSFCKTLT